MSGFLLKIKSFVFNERVFEFLIAKVLARRLDQASFKIKNKVPLQR